MKLQRTLGVLGLATLVGVAAAGRGGRSGRQSMTRRKLACLNITLRLNDDTYCPGGIMTGREGRVEGRDDRMRVYVVARTTGGQDFQIRRNENANLRVVVRKFDKQTREVGAVVKRSTFRLTGRFNGSDRRILCATFRPPSEPGDYIVKASLGGSTKDSTRIGVWYDRGACPRPGTRPPQPPPPPPPPPPPTVQPPVGSGMAKCLAVTLNVNWTCENGAGSAQVTVRNTHQSMSIPVHGIGHTGIGNLSGFVRSSGSDVLAPGQSAVFRASGTIMDGSRTMRAWVTNLPDAKDSSQENVACGPNYNDLY